MLDKYRFFPHLLQQTRRLSFALYPLIIAGPRSLFSSLITSYPTHLQRPTGNHSAIVDNDSSSAHPRTFDNTAATMHLPPTTLLLPLLLASSALSKPLPATTHQHQSLADIERRWSAGETEVSCRPNLPGCYIYAWFEHMASTLCSSWPSRNGVRLPGLRAPTLSRTAGGKGCAFLLTVGVVGEHSLRHDAPGRHARVAGAAGCRVV